MYICYSITNLIVYTLLFRGMNMNEQNIKERRQQLILRYRAACIQHTWTMATFRTNIAGVLTIGEALTILSLYIIIRMKLRLGLIGPFAVMLGAIFYFAMKTALQYCAALTARSQEFCKPSSFRSLSKEDRCRLASCKPLTVVIGSTFTVTKQSFLTISQDIILINVINLLVAY